MLIVLIAATFFFGWTVGRMKADKMLEKEINYWYQESQRYMHLWLDAIKPDDDGGKRLPLPEEKPEPVKAMAAGVGR